jgi:MSHA pilin protein MshC
MLLKQAGFSLIQLIITIVIISILMVAIILRNPDSRAFQSEGYADVLAQNIRLAKIMAISLNERYSIQVNSGSLQIKDTSGTAINHPENGNTTFNFPTGVTISPVTTIQFDSVGRPYNNAGVLSINNTVFTVTAGTNTKTVTVVPETGFIE